jgi:hypothetical protein
MYILVNFSSAMRELHNQKTISGDDESTRKFLELRDQTRLNALIYARKILPKSDEVVSKIKTFANDITNCEYAEWQASLSEIIQKITNSVEACQQLMNLHECLITEFKRSEDNAHVGLEALAKLKREYEEDRDRHLNSAAEKTKSKARYDKLAASWGMLFTTLGVGNLLAKVISAKCKEDSKANQEKASVSKERGEITTEMANLTEAYMVPAIKNIMQGLQSCCNFLIATKEELTEMSTDRKGERIFRTMRKHAKELDTNCLAYLTTSSETRTNLSAIHTKPTDESYIDRWLSNQIGQVQICESR